jgi:DNA-binding transcriptional LysR family regulator
MCLTGRHEPTAHARASRVKQSGWCIMDQGPEFRHFASFVAVAETCNFGKAAERLGIAQPTLSLQIKQLEEWAGERLFQRLPTGSPMTEAGRHFLVIAQQMLHMRSHAKHVTVKRSGEWPFRLGYSQFARHELIDEAIEGYKEIVPGGSVQASSDCTAHLLHMLEDGRLEAAVVTLPIGRSDLFEQRICEDRLLICLRKDDPLAKLDSIPKAAVSERLQVMFHRDYHPHFYDRLMARFLRAGIRINPTETYSALSEMQYIVKARGCLGLIREHAPLDPELTTRPVVGLSLKAITALVCHADQQRPAIPVLAYRMAQRCLGRNTNTDSPKKPSQSVNPSEPTSRSHAS